MATSAALEETALTTLETKLVQLRRARDKSDNILQTGKENAIRRHVETLKEIVNEVSKWQRLTEAEKIKEKVDPSEIDAWLDEIETKLDESDEQINLLEEWLTDAREKREHNEHKKKVVLEMELYEAKLKLQGEHNSKPEATENEIAKPSKFKLPDLTITPFDGSYSDWPRFWGQFTANIDKSNIPAVNKFGYLREYLSEKPKKAIEALPYTAEGYNRALAILKDRFGKESEIVKAYVKDILNLPHIPTANVKKIHEFHDQLAYCVQSLETLNQLEAVNGTVSLTLEKLSAIRGDVVRNDPEWENWNFVQFTEALRLWTRRNPVDNHKSDDSKKKPERRQGGYQFATQQQQKTRQISKTNRNCVYCNSESHKSTECDTVLTFEDRKRFLAANHLCFNCTGPSHRASNCRCPSNCQLCKKRHHTSICDTLKVDEREPAKSAHSRTDNEVIYPVVLVEVEGIKTHALLDTGAGSSYASSDLISAIKKKPKDVQTKRIEMMLGSTTTRVEIFAANIKSVDKKFELDIDVSKVNKPELMKLNNPNYEQLLDAYSHLKGVKIDDPDKRAQIPIHLVLGASDYAKIKTTTSQRVGCPGEPVAERTLLGWTVMSPGKEGGSPILITQSATVDYEQLCALDVLGLPDRSENDQETVYQEFEEQLQRNEAGWYETRLPWRGNHPPLPTNETGSKRRLEQLVKKLERNNQYAAYEDIIQEQLSKDVIEPATTPATGNEYYIPHKAVVKGQAETTKLRVVYDASAKEREDKPSLNDCLHPGPPLQNLLWDVLIRARFHPILLTGDLKQAFLQVRVREDDRDSLRFHWKHPGSDTIQGYRFTRALFGLTCSPFLLGGVLKHHLDMWEGRYPEVVRQLRHSMYVDDLITGGTTVPEVSAQKEKMTEIFDDAGFTIHKWHSNVPEIEPVDEPPLPEPNELTYAKSQLGGTVKPDGKLLGLLWSRHRDTLSITLTKETGPVTKRGVLSKLAKIYDPLGLASPTTLTGKLIYRDICDAKVPWDSDLPQHLRKRWAEWISSLENLEIPRSLAPHHQPFLEITLHGFGDASSRGVCAAIYAVIRQEAEVTQGLVCAKSRIAKRNLTIPRLELISGHMAANLVSNVQATVTTHQVNVHCWLDAMVALYWIHDQGEYRQFVANRVQKIRQHQQITWHHVPTKDNPADIGSRGGNVVNNELWEKGPPWLSNPPEWPSNQRLEPTSETRSEAKATKEIFAATTALQDEFDRLLDKHQLPKVLKIGAWIRRFVNNCRTQPRDRDSGPIKTEEIKQQELWWIRRVQAVVQEDSRFQSDKLQLNLQPNDDRVLECRGRIIGDYPVYLPDTHPFTAQVVRRAHILTLHGGIGFTMAKVRERFWVPRLRRLTKKIRSKCHGCRRIQAKAYQSPPPGKLPTTRTQGTTPFQVIGVDFAGPITYSLKSKKEAKAYLVLYSCSLTRAVHLDLVKSLTTPEFILSLKEFIARRGRPEIVYSDNATTYKAAAKWIRQVRKDEQLNDLLATLAIEWCFNLSRAPWWGGQFKRLIGVFKDAFRKSVGNGTLTWTELTEVVLDIEVTMNNRPLNYLEDDVELLPTLTPNTFLHINPINLPELQGHHIPEVDLRKRAKFLLKCKQAMWNRWTREYVRTLREQHRLTGTEKTNQPNSGDVVIIKEDQKPRNTWKLAIVKQLITGRDGVVRGAKLKTAGGINAYLERAVQHLYPLELECDTEDAVQLNPEAAEFTPRPRRAAAIAATKRIHDIAMEEQEH